MSLLMDFTVAACSTPFALHRPRQDSYSQLLPVTCGLEGFGCSASISRECWLSVYHSNLCLGRMCAGLHGAS